MGWLLSAVDLCRAATNNGLEREDAGGGRPGHVEAVASRVGDWRRPGVGAGKQTNMSKEESPLAAVPRRHSRPGGCGLWLPLLLYAAPGFAAHPLITEDTATQGRGNGQLELTAEYGHDEASDAREDALDLAAVLTYGLRNELDLLLTLPYSRADTLARGAETTAHGIGDVGLDAKWRFLEAGRWSMALKTGVTFPTGDDTRNLGAGKFNVSANIVTAYETARWGYYLHLGHIRNRNVHGERDVIHHASVALVHTVSDRLKLVADLGQFTSTDRSVSVDARFLTLGVIFGIRDDLDLDFGWKRGLTDPETDTTLLLGMALRF
ncbi:MAG: transporter [Hyphomicrobiaceae bacterium]